jgi:short-subunit dehydrogenase involved in D-alanine esterification of teichoic acids
MGVSVKTVVMTGGTRGLGHGLGDVFLAQGRAVGIGGRTAQNVGRAVEMLSDKRDLFAGMETDGR